MIAHRDGYGFVALDEGGDDMFLPPSQMHTVMHGDYVSVQHDGFDRRGRPIAVFREVLERNHETVVGRYTKRGDHPSVIVPETPRILHRFEVLDRHRKRAKDGDLVLADITRFPDRKKPAQARITRVLGAERTEQVDVELAIAAFCLSAQWPDAVQRELPGLDALEEEQQRTDRTDLPFVTIDGETARDYDDAVFCQEQDDGWLLWVAIADVSHYVRPGTALDAEARSRGTSVYFPNRVVPMLPPELSEDRCSLMPGQERRALICRMRIDRDGSVRKTRLELALIRSHARLTYSEVDRALFSGGGKGKDMDATLRTQLEPLRSLYRVLRKTRATRGALDFDTPEIRFCFDSRGRLSGIGAHSRLDAHRLIEECMLAANAAAAERLFRSGIPTLYRIHDVPQGEKIKTLRALLASLGIEFPAHDPITPTDCADLIARVADDEHRQLIERAVLRTQSLSVYSPENIGHFGLALERYTHFTSPIRRYPDLMVHRALRRSIAGGKHDGSDLQEIASHCSMAERRADEAVWDVEAVYKGRLTQPHVGNDWPGIINSVTPFGVFVELEDLYSEGLVHISKMSGYYQYDAEAQVLRREADGKELRSGQHLTVHIQEVNLRERRIDLLLAES